MSKQYDMDDIVTWYFVIIDDGRNLERIQAYSDNKEYVNAYMEFHKCKFYRMKKVTQRYRDIIAILNENANDEIDIVPLTIRNPNHKKGDESKIIMAPLTTTEQSFIRGEIDTFMATRIDYSCANDMVYYLRGKYLKALKDILFIDVMNHVVNNWPNDVIESLSMDELMVFARSLPEHFGQ